MTYDFTIVLGEHTITPGAIVQLVFRARLVPVTEEIKSQTPVHNLDLNERHQAFWAMRNDAEEISRPPTVLAHTPRWPTVSVVRCASLFVAQSTHKQDKKPYWWVFIGDQKQNRIFVPPMRFTDVPLCLGTSPASGSEDRLYKITFQAPPSVGSLSLQVRFVSDTFVVDDIRKSITVWSLPHISYACVCLTWKD